MSEHHDTNEDERDWPAYRAERAATGAEVAEDALAIGTPAMIGRMRVIVSNTGDSDMLRGFDQRIARGCPCQRGA